MEYIYNIDNRIFNSNLHPIENNILENLNQYYDLIKDFQECKGRLMIEGKEKLEEKVSNIFKKEEKRENKSLKNVTEEIMHGFDIYDKLKNEFLESKNNYDNSVHQFDNLIKEKRYLKSELELIKSLNLKLKKMLKEQKKIYQKLKLMESEEKEIKDLNKTNEDNKNKIGNEPNIKRNKSIKNTKNNFLNNNKNYKTNYYNLFSYNKNNKKQYNQRLILKNVSKYNNKSYTIKKHFFSYDSKTTKNNIKSQKTKLIRNLSTNKISNVNNLVIQTNFANSPISTLIKKTMHKSATTTSLFSAENKFHNRKNFGSNKKAKIKDDNNNYKDNDEKKYLMAIVDYIKAQTEIKNDCVTMINTFISDEIQTMMWVKDFFAKLIRDLRYDIYDINMTINYNSKINVDNKDLEIELKKNEKLLNISSFIYDNCLKGNNKTNYILNESKNNKNQNKLFVTENK